ncbi:glycosyltransferase family 4 protein [Jannaschia sp. W003]|uniref:glycosyltransferase family 4 protein n=1 Tax=Jannaschia sp. W003 TaxID=2867012 RepID=UPI0021A3F9D6|nr:glycosyltransferase family 4 protein [Jannaschia sp. W003]UWQ23194.1 glycosyltransferase family 4 protein [Jannaschia sp. W003]
MDLARIERLERALVVGDFAALTGGQAKVAIDQARLLAEAGVDVTFFAATGPASDRLDHPRIRTVCLDGHTLLSDPNRMRAMARGLWNRDAARALAAEAARYDPARTVLLCHGWAKALSPAVGPVLAGGPLRCLYTMHEYFLACPNGGFFDYRARAICTRTPLGPACLARNCDARHAAHKAWRVARGALARGPGRLPGGLRDVAYISETQRRAMAPHLAKGTRLHHLPNPVAAGGAPVDARANRDFVFVGRLSPEKGGAMFAEAARRAGLRAVFVGDGPEADAIRAANPDAEITGWVEPEAVQARLARARAVVFPSLWYEGQPLVPIEALLRGIPVVCGDWSAAAEVVRDGRNGAVYHAPEVPALAEALRRVEAVGPFDPAALADEVAPKRHLARLVAICEGMLAHP